jgi:peroxiredoxin
MGKNRRGHANVLVIQIIKGSNKGKECEVMKRASLLFLTIIASLLFVSSAFSQGLVVGNTMENFSLPDTNGATKALNDLKGKNGAVVIFLSAQCPVVRGYVARINELAAGYQAKGINFIGINSNATEDLNWVKSNVTEYGYKFPVLIDKGSVLADKLGATVTPEAYYVDANGVLLYHGAIDNDRSGKNVTDSYLKTAFDSSLSGKKITRTSANAFGCSIKKSAD